jgi:hypothetical protein
MSFYLQISAHDGLIVEEELGGTHVFQFILATGWSDDCLPERTVANFVHYNINNLN